MFILSSNNFLHFVKIIIHILYKMNRAFEIRLYPNKEQQRLLDSTFGACRFVYNNVLSIRQAYFKDYKFKSTDLNIMD